MGVWRCTVAVICILAGCGRIGFDALDDGGGGGGDGGGGEGGGNGLSVVAVPPTINVGSKAQLEARGGAAPYTFSLEGGGTLTGTTFIAPTPAGQSIVRVTDANGDTAMVTIAYRGERLFVAGGQNGGMLATVLSSTDGVAWTTVGMLPAARANGALVVYDDRMYYFGGLDPASNATSGIFASTDGVAWSQIGNLPVPRTGITCIVHAGELWIVGGFTGASNTTTAYHSSDSVSWTVAGNIAAARHENDVVSRDGLLYVLGGHGTAGFLNDIQSSADGSQWTPSASTLTFAAESPGAAELGDRVFRVCGSSCTQTETSLDLSTWTPGAPLPGGSRDGPALIGFAGRLLVIGGGSSVLATVDGSSWSTIGSLPASRILTAVVQFTPP